MLLVAVLKITDVASIEKGWRLSPFWGLIREVDSSAQKKE
jgi:hypothetical protein